MILERVFRFISVRFEAFLFKNNLEINITKLKINYLKTTISKNVNQIKEK